MEHDFIWAYMLIFLAIPLARIIPRLLSRRARGDRYPDIGQESSPKASKGEPEPSKHEDISGHEDPSGKDADRHQKIPEPSKPQTKEMVVLGELHRGARTFENIQKNTGMDGGVLERILEKLEKDGLLKVVQRQRMLGSRVELHPTDKGFREYYS